MATVAELRAELTKRRIPIPAGARKADLEQLLADEPLTNVGAVQHALEKIAERDPDLARSPYAATALALAREMDGRNSATSKSMCAKALTETIDRLRELAPDEPTADGVDDLERRREQRKAQQAKAAGG